MIDTEALAHGRVVVAGVQVDGAAGGAPALAHLVEDGPSHHVASGELQALGIVALHEALTHGVQQPHPGTEERAHTDIVAPARLGIGEGQG
jgi:hypothetical protein